MKFEWTRLTICTSFLVQTQDTFLAHPYCSAEEMTLVQIRYELCIKSASEQQVDIVDLPVQFVPVNQTLSRPLESPESVP